MAYLNFESAMQTLESWGLSDVIMPFLLVFTIVYAILAKTRLMGEDKKNFNIMLALIMALSVIIPHVTSPGSRYDVVDIINQALPHVSLLIVIILMALLLIGIFGVGPMWSGSSITGGIALLAFIAVVYIFGAAANFWGTITWLYWLNDPQIQSLIVVILIFAIIVWFITKDEKKTPGEGFLRGFGDMFRGPKQ